MISIVFPHLINKENDAVLKLNLKMIQENTSCDYEVLYLASTYRPDLVYTGLDWLMRTAKYDLILWHSTDIVLAKDWDKNVLVAAKDGDWIGLELIECGAIGVAPTNINENFGITARTFKRKKFEDRVLELSANRADYRDGFGWYSPSVWRKDFYIRHGGFDLSKPFPWPADMDFKHRVEYKARFLVANSFAYHFQRARENSGERKERK